MTPSRAVLVTGAASGTGLSSGTGRATALHLHRAGWPVYATGRDPRALKELAAEGVNVLPLDLTDEQSMVAAVEHITDKHGAVGALVNNAAWTLVGTVEETPLEAVRRQFETNVFGLARLTQLVLPGMRAQHHGRILFMSSMFGLFGTPGRGYYQATKHGVEALGDSLRHEVAHFGIRVSVVEPSPILGGFIPTTVSDLRIPAEGHTGLYDDFWKKQASAPYLNRVSVPTLHVAGWFDQEDFYGPLKTYELLERHDGHDQNFLVVGPWNHGGWRAGTGNTAGTR